MTRSTKLLIKIFGSLTLALVLLVGCGSNDDASSEASVSISESTVVETTEQESSTLAEVSEESIEEVSESASVPASVESTEVVEESSAEKRACRTRSQQAISASRQGVRIGKQSLSLCKRGRWRIDEYGCCRILQSGITLLKNADPAVMDYLYFNDESSLNWTTEDGVIYFGSIFYDEQAKTVWKNYLKNLTFDLEPKDRKVYPANNKEIGDLVQFVEAQMGLLPYDWHNYMTSEEMEALPDAPYTDAETWDPIYDQMYEKYSAKGYENFVGDLAPNLVKIGENQYLIKGDDIIGRVTWSAPYVYDEETKSVVKTYRNTFYRLSDIDYSGITAEDQKYMDWINLYNTGQYGAFNDAIMSEIKPGYNGTGDSDRAEIMELETLVKTLPSLPQLHLSRSADTSSSRIGTVGALSKWDSSFAYPDDANALQLINYPTVNIAMESGYRKSAIDAGEEDPEDSLEEAFARLLEDMVDDKQSLDITGTYEQVWAYQYWHATN